MTEMLIEVSQLIGCPVIVGSSTVLGRVDLAVFQGKEARLRGFQIAQPGIVSKFRGLLLDDVVEISRHQLTIKDVQQLATNLVDLQRDFTEFGPVINVRAKTESGKSLGTAKDVVVEAETGQIVRFYLQNFLQERIIPRQFLVAITPREVVFKDVVTQPIFNQLAVSETA